MCGFVDHVIITALPSEDEAHRNNEHLSRTSTLRQLVEENNRFL